MKYSQGVCEDGAAILRDGIRMTIDEIVAALNSKYKLHQELIDDLNNMAQEIKNSNIPRARFKAAICRTCAKQLKDLQ